MLELGEKSEEEHIKIHKVLSDNNLKNVMLAGPIFHKVSAGFRFQDHSQCQQAERVS